MIPLPFLTNKTIGVLGLGKTGLASVAALLDAGAQVLVWDDGDAARESFAAQWPEAALKPVADWPWDGVDRVVLSPGLPYTHPQPHPGVVLAQTHGVEIVADIELLYRACPDARYIAITGTNGKSTTTSLIAHILKEAGREVEVGGNLGMPALGLKGLDKSGFYVLELSSYQLDLLRTTQFNIAVLLNFSPDHLDRHGDMAGYIEAKKHIFERQQTADIAVIGVDDATAQALCREMITAAQQTIIPIMTTQRSDKGIWVKDGVLHDAQSGYQMEMAKMPALQGTHNHQNAAAAYAACKAAGLTPQEIETGMRSFPGLAHRMQRVGVVDGILCINDSKATNADAAAKSLGTYENIYWIAGGKSKEGGIGSLAPYFPRIRHAFLIGAAQEEFAQTLEGQVPYQRSGTLDKAWDAALKQARKDGAKDAVILLAPACASFDQFKNFEERGDMFARLVQGRLEPSPLGRGQGEGPLSSMQAEKYEQVASPHPNPLPEGEGTMPETEEKTHAI